MNNTTDSLEQLEPELATLRRVPASTEPTHRSRPTLVPPMASLTFTPEILSLVQRIFLATTDQPLRQVVFCGVDEPNGSSQLCAEVARCLAAHTEDSVCVLNVNRTVPAVAGKLAGNASPVPLDPHSDLQLSALHGAGELWLATPCSPTASLQVRETLTALHERFEYVLIDVAGALVHGDAMAWGSAADGLVLVVEANITRREAARKAMQSLQAAGVRILGSVLRGRSLPIPEAIYRRL